MSSLTILRDCGSYYQNTEGDKEMRPSARQRKARFLSLPTTDQGTELCPRGHAARAPPDPDTMPRSEASNPTEGDDETEGIAAETDASSTPPPPGEAQPARAISSADIAMNFFPVNML